MVFSTLFSTISTNCTINLQYIQHKLNQFKRLFRLFSAKRMQNVHNHSNAISIKNSFILLLKNNSFKFQEKKTFINLLLYAGLAVSRWQRATALSNLAFRQVGTHMYICMQSTSSSSPHICIFMHEIFAFYNKQISGYTNLSLHLYKL